MLAELVAIALQDLPKMADSALEGWKLKVEASLLLEKGVEWSRTKAELTRQLQNIVRVVPDEPLRKLREVTIWIHKKSPETPCMAYHPGAEWLRQHKMEPEMAKAIEIGNTQAFVSWTYEQPWMVLHELAHAYHDRFLDQGFENPDVKSGYERIKASNKYESVVHWSGGEAKHYALTNQMEYFAETTESYFGTNDFYPFVRAELMRFDPETFKLMEKIWGPRFKREG